MPVGQNLNFDVARVGKAFLKVDFIVAECHFCFRTPNVDVLQKFVHVLSVANSTAPTPCNRLHHDGEAVPFGESRRDLFSFIARRKHLRSGDHGNSRSLHDLACYYLAAHIDYDLGRRSDENEARFRALLRKSRIFGKKTVTGVYRIGLAALCRLYNALDIEVIAPGPGSDADGFIGAHDVHGRLVRLFVDGYSLYSKLFGGAHYANGDLASVCNQQLFEHLPARFQKKIIDYSLLEMDNQLVYIIGSEKSSMS